MFLEENRDRILKEFDGFCREFPGVAGEIAGELEKLDADTALAMKYLYANMPTSDMGNYSFGIFLDYARHGVWLWENSPYRKEMPEDIFLNYVLYHRINEEEIKPCRAFFGEQLAGCVAGHDIETAALEVNYWCASEMTYQSTDARTSSALDVYRCGYGRCGEESVFAVNALRSVGVPARQVYATRWAHCDDNHAWVEVWCNGTWHYMGACEPEPVLDKGWFTNASSRAMIVCSRWFDVKEPTEEVVGRDGIDLILNQLPRYAPTKRIAIRVIDRNGNPVKNARVSVEILNYSEFSSVAMLETDWDGIATFETGYGSLHLSVFAGDCSGESLIDTRMEDSFCCVLGEEPLFNVWSDFDITAPTDTVGNDNRVTPAQEEENSRRTAEAARRCRNKRDSFQPLWRDSFWGPDQTEAEQLMSYLTDKDRNDALPEVLKEHYEESFRYRGQYPDVLFFPYIWNPRVKDEILTKWRRTILQFFNQEEQENFREEPGRIWDWIKQRISDRPERERRSIYTTPAAVLKLGIADEKSCKVLFVAIARTLGVPARLSTVDGEMEYWNGTAFVRVIHEQKKSAHITINGPGDTSWTYYQNWSIAKAGAKGYQTLMLRDLSWENGKIELDVEPGQYRVLTVNRLPTGNIFAKRYDFHIAEGEHRSITLELREAKLSDLLDSHELPGFYMRNQSEEPVSFADISSGKKKILFWLDVGKEPTEHILNELMELKTEFALCQDQLAFILRGPETLKDITLCKCREVLPDVRILYDSFGKCEEMIARRMYVDPGQLPLLVVTSGELNGIFAASGYSVGMADLLLRILKA